MVISWLQKWCRFIYDFTRNHWLNLWINKIESGRSFLSIWILIYNRLFIVKELLYSKNSYLIWNYKNISVSIPIWTWTYGWYDGDWRGRGRLCHVTNWDICPMPNVIKKTTLGKSTIPLVYENLFKIFCCYACHELWPWYESWPDLKHEVDSCDVG